MGDELQPKAQQEVVKFCPSCGLEFDKAGEGNVKHKCPECESNFLVRQF